MVDMDDRHKELVVVDRAVWRNIDEVYNKGNIISSKFYK